MILQRKTKEHNPNWPTDNTYIVLIIPVSRSGKTNSLFNLISYLANIYMYGMNPNEVKYQLFIKETFQV